VPYLPSPLSWTSAATVSALSRLDLSCTILAAVFVPIFSSTDIASAEAKTT